MAPPGQVDGDRTATGPLDSAAMNDVRVRRARTDDLSASEVEAIRAILWAAFDDLAEPDESFTEHDWTTASAGSMWWRSSTGGSPPTVRSWPARSTPVGGRSPRATSSRWRPILPSSGRAWDGGHARDRAVIGEAYEVGFLGTGEHGFYERLGWQTWRGPSFVRTPDGERATPGDDGYLMVLRTPTSPPLDLDTPISCEWRPGDVW